MPTHNAARLPQPYLTCPITRPQHAPHKALSRGTNGPTPRDSLSKLALIRCYGLTEVFHSSQSSPHTLSPRTKTKTKTKAQHEYNPLKTTPSCKPDTNQYASSSKGFASDRDPSQRDDVSKSYYAAEKVNQVLPSVTSAVLASTQSNSQELNYSHVADQTSFRLTSAILASIQDTPQEMNYSLTCFIAEAIDGTYVSAEDAMHAHTSAMSTYIDNFDAIFYQE